MYLQNFVTFFYVADNKYWTLVNLDSPIKNGEAMGSMCIPVKQLKFAKFLCQNMIYTYVSLSSTRP